MRLKIKRRRKYYITNQKCVNLGANVYKYIRNIIYSARKRPELGKKFFTSEQRKLLPQECFPLEVYTYFPTLNLARLKFYGIVLAMVSCILGTIE